jgi:hypothetical protein
MWKRCLAEDFRVEQCCVAFSKRRHWKKTFLRETRRRVSLVCVSKPRFTTKGIFGIETGKPSFAVVAGHVYLVVVEIGENEAKNFKGNAHSKTLMRTC